MVLHSYIISTEYLWSDHDILVVLHKQQNDLIEGRHSYYAIMILYMEIIFLHFLCASCEKRMRGCFKDNQKTYNRPNTPQNIFFSHFRQSNQNVGQFFTDLGLNFNNKLVWIIMYSMSYISPPLFSN